MQLIMNYILYTNTDGSEETHIWSDEELLEVCESKKTVNKLKKGEIVFFGSGSYVNMLAAARKQLQPYKDAL